jgi:phage regulator Rha-like protein
MSSLVHTTVAVEERDGILVVDSRIIAERLGVQHKNFLDTINTHKESIEAAFGRVAFETRPFETAGGTQQVKVAFLTEEQATAIMTLSRNTPQVVELKMTLVKAFVEAKKARTPEQMLVQPQAVAGNKYAMLRGMLDQMEALDEQVQQHETRLTVLERVVVAQQLYLGDPPPKYFTVLGWANRCGIFTLTHDKALKLGRKAASLSKANGVPVSKIADAKYGQVNAYHADILRTVFAMPV